MKNAKILIVDDDTDFVFSTRTVLEGSGYEVISAGNGSQGRATLAREKPHLVILDVIMSSVLDGVSMSRFMREEQEYRDIPIIMVTSIANTDYQGLFPTDESIEIDAFLTKPIKPADLTGKVSELLSKREGKG
ncbi:MAG TPA: response regulator [Deltaproteobacteria bacterium]|jgi:two-component system alkaline phosphatase synthesis response regulator PhoP|nr:response regulator [Deltaproteobacteria bacterium]HOI05751.1 response regulator [Deltaproteobacteria bacterium]